MTDASPYSSDSEPGLVRGRPSTTPIAPPMLLPTPLTSPILRPLGEPTTAFDSPVRESQMSDQEASTPMTSPMRTPARSPRHPSHSSSSSSSSFSLSSPTPFSPSGVLTQSYHQASDALDSANVHVSSIASNYMLMEYAAQIKGMTQLKVVRSVKRLKHFPREVAETASMVKAEAVRVLALIRAHIEEIASGRQAQKAKMEQIKNSHSFLQAATELLNQAEVETVKEVRKRRMSHRQSFTMPQTHELTVETSPSPSPSPAAQDAVSSLASLMAAMKSSPASAALLTTPPTPVAASPSASPTATADAAKISELASLVQALSAQMAALKAGTPTSTGAMPLQAPGGAVASVGPTIPMAPRQTPQAPIAPPLMMSVVAAPAKTNVPRAPTLKPDSFFFTGVHQDVDAEAAEADQATSTPDDAKSFSGGVPSRGGILGEITNRTTVLTPVGARVGGQAPRKRLSQRSQSVIDSSTTTKAAAPSVIHCYTRRIPGSETMSLTDSIKVASRIKLRRTEQDRSPGGTPRREGRAFSTSSTQDVLQAALQARFKNVHAMEGAMTKHQQLHHQQRSQSVVLNAAPLQPVDEMHHQYAPAAHGHVTKRTSTARANATGAQRRNSIDKENWETA